MRVSLHNKISILLLIMLLIAASNLFTIFFFHNMEKDNVYVINLAGRQRMLTQKISKLAVLMIYEGGRSRTEIENDILSYELSLKLLYRGNKDNRHGDYRVINPAPPELTPIFERNLKVWKEFKDNIERIIDGNGNQNETIEAIHNESDELLILNNNITNKFESMMEERKRLLRILLFLMLGVDIAVFIVGYLAVSRLVAPLKRLNEAVTKIGMGDYFQKIPIPDFNDEIRDLTVVFNNMAANLYTTIISKEFLYGIINTATDMLFVIDIDGLIQLANISVINSLEYPQDELIGTNFDRIYVDSEGKAIPALLRNIFESRGGYNIEAYVRSKSGRDIPVLCSFSKMKDESGESYEIVCTAKDITERKAYEADLRKMSAAFEQSLSAMLITDIEGRIEFVNAKFTENTGYTLDELKGKNPRILKSGKHGHEFYKSLWTTILSGKEFRSDICNRKKDGTLSWELISIAPIKDTSGKITHFIAVKIDDLERRQAEDRLKHLALHDALTGLPNRVLFEDRLQQAIFKSNRDNLKFAVMLLDLDRFKLVNDTLGHSAGDLLLKGVTTRLLKCVRGSDTVCRMGGDEFQILLLEISESHTVSRVAEKVIDSLNTPFIIENQECSIGVSIGISVYPDNGTDIVTLLKNADVAMYQIKESGKNSFKFYDPSMDTANFERIRIENDMRIAIKNSEFILHYQPQVDLDTGKIIGVESLIRWRHPEIGLISPARFIPIAEESGFINTLGDWVFETACKQAVIWHKMGYSELHISINLSGKQFQQLDLLKKIKKVLTETMITPGLVDVELTESVVMNNLEASIKLMNEIKSIGIKLSIDDFGTGYSSLLYLKKFPIDILKIDQGFIKNSTTDSADAVITSTIISLAHSLNFKVIAEGVEIADQLELLRTFKCDAVQGYIFSKPLPAEELTQLLKEEDHLTVKH